MPDQARAQVLLGGLLPGGLALQRRCQGIGQGGQHRQEGAEHGPGSSLREGAYARRDGDGIPSL